MRGSPLQAQKPLPAPGQVWWCDGVALAFEPMFKRRPVLIVALPPPEEPEGQVRVIPLSSRRHYGQETAVVHSRGVSYMTGVLAAVEVSALVGYLGEWAGFPLWYEEQRQIAETLLERRPWWRRCQDWFIRIFDQRRNR